MEKGKSCQYFSGTFSGILRGQGSGEVGGESRVLCIFDSLLILNRVWKSLESCGRMGKKQNGVRKNKNLQRGKISFAITCWQATTLIFTGFVACFYAKRYPNGTKSQRNSTGSPRQEKQCQ